MGLAFPCSPADDLVQLMSGKTFLCLGEADEGYVNVESLADLPPLMNASSSRPTRC